MNRRAFLDTLALLAAQRAAEAQPAGRCTASVCLKSGRMPRWMPWCAPAPPGARPGPGAAPRWGWSTRFRAIAARGRCCWSWSSSWPWSYRPPHRGTSL